MTTRGSHVIVIGAGVAGLGSALALSRAGHRVTLLERDATPLPADPDAAFLWDRRGAPQVRHSHALLARLRNLLRDRFPDVLDALIEAGATEMRFADNLPVEITDREPQPGDEDLVALACRRTTFEWVLRRAVLAASGVQLLDGTVAESLVATPGVEGAAPTVTGVVITAKGQPARTLEADMVVATVGRRSAVPRLLSNIGVDLAATSEETGIVYLSRFYRLLDGAELPDSDGPIGGDLGYLKYAVFQGDNRTFSVTFAVATHDDELRSLLIGPEGFELAAATLPTTLPWVQTDRAEPITEVHVMGGLLNRRVDFLDDDGHPVVLGFHAAGDAHTCTNPLYGRGCSLAMVQATLLADALDRSPRRPGRPVDRLRAGQRPRDPALVQGRGQPGPPQPGRGRDAGRRLGNRRRRRRRRRARRAPFRHRCRGHREGVHARPHEGRADAGRAHRRHRLPGLRAVVQPARPARRADHRPGGGGPGDDRLPGARPAAARAAPRPAAATSWWPSSRWPEVGMSKLIYAAITSLDGYVADRDGAFDWSAPDEEVHAFVNDLERPIGTYLYGRRLYEVMRFWDTDEARTDPSPVVRDFAGLWQAADKIVYSTTLSEPSTSRTRLERAFEPDVIRRLKAGTSRDLSVGGPELAAHAIRAGLVDECHLFVNPIVIGGGNPWLPDDVRWELELLDERRFAGGVVHLHYRTKA